MLRVQNTQQRVYTVGNPLSHRLPHGQRIHEPMCRAASQKAAAHNDRAIRNELSDLLKTDSRVYLLGGEVTSTDAHTLFSSPENPSTFTNHVFVSKAFTSISGIDLQAGLTVHSIVSTHIYRNLPSIARSWYLMADHHKFGQIAMYPVAELDAFQYLIADDVPEDYRTVLCQSHTKILLTQQDPHAG